MSSQLMDRLVEELNEKIGDRTFFTLSELVSPLGLFGTVRMAREALKGGQLPFLRISARRCVIPRTALLDYIRNNIEEHEASLSKPE